MYIKLKSTLKNNDSDYSNKQNSRNTLPKKRKKREKFKTTGYIKFEYEEIQGQIWIKIKLGSNYGNDIFKG